MNARRRELDAWRYIRWNESTNRVRDHSQANNRMFWFVLFVVFFVVGFIVWPVWILAFLSFLAMCA